MNVEFEALPNCLATLKISVSPDKVSKAVGEVTSNYAKYAKLPGFRPGKAPRSVVEKKFSKEIREEVTKQVLSDACREAIKDKGLRVLSLSEVEDVVWGDDQSLAFRATLVLHPTFDLPDYKGIPVTVPSAEVTEAEIDEAIENLREQQADFPDIEPARPAAMDDFIVVDYDGTIDGEPVHVKFPKAGKPLSHNADFWIKMTDEAFFPGFCQQLVGANIGDTREFDIEVPADFPVEGMPGTKVHYKVAIKGLKARKLPELDDTFASSIAEGKSLAELRIMAREELQRQKHNNIDAAKRNGVMSALLSKVECELPTAMVRNQTQSILQEIVRENQTRGVAEEVIKEHEKDLVGSAAQSARDRIKGTFILLRVAEQEKIQVTEMELRTRIAQLARKYEMTFDKMLKELQKRGALDQISEEILTAKTLDFVAKEASVTTSAEEAKA
ncbi:MAG: trigger factor [Verrucomicrobiota bacterium]|jgi:trigger factor